MKSDRELLRELRDALNKAPTPGFYLMVSEVDRRLAEPDPVPFFDEEEVVGYVSKAFGEKMARKMFEPGGSVSFCGMGGPSET